MTKIQEGILAALDQTATKTWEEVQETYQRVLRDLVDEREFDLEWGVGYRCGLQIAMIAKEHD